MISHWKKTWEKGTKGETAVPWAVWARFLQKLGSSMEGGVPAPAAAAAPGRAGAAVRGADPQGRRSRPLSVC